MAEIRGRLNRVNNILKDWMLEKEIRATSPKQCINLLVEKGIYNSSRRDGLLLRNDFREIRDNIELPYETNDLIILQAKNRRWYIVLKWESSL